MTALLYGQENTETCDDFTCNDGLFSWTDSEAKEN